MTSKEGAGNVPEPETRQEKLERERLTRRAALAKLGLRAGAAVLAALSVEDLARMASKELQRRSGDNAVANAVAKEFKNAGVAFASSSDASLVDEAACAKCVDDGVECSHHCDRDFPNGSDAQKLCNQGCNSKVVNCRNGHHCD